MNGFFSRSELAVVKTPTPRVPQCGSCGLLNHCRSPKMPVAGKGKRGILIVGEAPGETEDERNRPFIGPAGQLLQRELRALGVDLFDDCWVTNALICRPRNNVITNPKSIEYCRPNVLKAIRELEPKTIVLLGGSAITSVIGHLWKDNVGKDGVTKWVGWTIPCQRWNAWVCPTFHPSHLLRNGDKADGRVLTLMFREHLERALGKTNRPWRTVPDYTKMIDIVLDSDAAAKQIAQFTQTIAFDFETTTLKPDGSYAQIVSCAISDGRKTIAYPWHGRAAVASESLLTNPDVPKVGWNAKFEHRTVQAILGASVWGWVWDGMLAAHALDSRTGITGLKFQSFVKLGIEDYDSHIKPFLKSKDGGGNSPNRIREIDLHTLLTYNGMDALLEHKLAHIQMKEMGCIND